MSQNAARPRKQLFRTQCHCGFGGCDETTLVEDCNGDTARYWICDWCKAGKHRHRREKPG